MYLCKLYVHLGHEIDKAYRCEESRIFLTLKEREI